METKEVIETNVKKLKLTYFDEGDDDIYELEEYKDLGDFCKGDKLKTFFEAFNLTLELLIENIQEDLKDIWERLDRLENK